MKSSERLSPEEQTQYILLENNCTNYEKMYGWKPGSTLKRISIWYGSNGLSRNIKQAYFVPADYEDSFGHTAWSDHVKEITGQLELDI